MSLLWLFEPLFSTFFHSTGILLARQSALPWPDNHLGEFYQTNCERNDILSFNDLQLQLKVKGENFHVAVQCDNFAPRDQQTLRQRRGCPRGHAERGDRDDR